MMSAGSMDYIYLVNHVRPICGSNHHHIPQALHTIKLCQELPQDPVSNVAATRGTKCCSNNEKFAKITYYTQQYYIVHKKPGGGGANKTNQGGKKISVIGAINLLQKKSFVWGPRVKMMHCAYCRTFSHEVLACKMYFYYCSPQIS